MTARFAGSRHLDDRRRRRLAQESEGRKGTRPATARETTGNSTGTAGAPSEGSAPLPLHESLIPRSYWIIGLIALFGLGAGLLVLWLGQPGRVSHAGFAELCDLQQGRLVSFFSTLALLSAAQFSFLILWYRSRCRKDFGGRYRIWGWAGCFWGSICLLTGTGLYRPLSTLMHSCWRIDCWRPLTVAWLVPFSIGVVALHRLLALEMRHSRLGRLIWSVTFCCGILAGGMQMGLELVLAEPVRSAAIAGVTMFWHYLLALSLLIHARFVVHITNEAAPRKQSWLSRTISGVQEALKRFLSRMRRRTGAPDRSDDQSQDPKETGTANGSKRASSPPTGTRKKAVKDGNGKGAKRVRIDPPENVQPPHETANPGRHAEESGPDEKKVPESSEDSRLSRKERRRRRKLERRRPSESG